MEEELDIIISATDNASDTFQSVSDVAEQMGASMQESAEEGSQGFEEVEDAAEGAEDPISQISTLLEGFVGLEVFSGLADALWDVADKAGTFEDSLMRARLEAEGAGIDVNEMTDAVSELSSTTGRAGSEIRESFIKATARGVTDLDSFKSMMEGAGAQATLFGTDIQTIADKYSGFASRSTIMEKALANTGITVEELGEALGIQGATIDDVNAKWKEMDENQRAAAIGMAASMNEGQTANEEYKNSWAGLQAQIDIAKGRIERLAGEVLLPVLIPALQVAARVLNFLGDTISAVMNGPLGGLISVVGAAAAAFALAVPAVMAVQGAMKLYEMSLYPAITATWELLAPWLPFIAIGAAIVLLIYEIGKAFGWWTDASSAIDAIWAGIQRLWSAFINHPDVQGFIQGVSDAWKAMQPYISLVINWVMSFFKNTDGSKFDVVRMWIDNIGKAWKAMTAPIRLVISVLKILWSAFTTTYQKCKAALDNAKNAFNNFKNNVQNTINRVKSIIQSITNVNISSITSRLTQPFVNAYNQIAREVDKIKQKASQIASNPLGALGFGFDIEGMLEAQAKGETNVTKDINLNVDLANVPAGVSTETLIAVLTDPAVLSALVGNNDFQSLDAKAKNRLALKNGRARGV